LQVYSGGKLAPPLYVCDLDSVDIKQASFVRPQIYILITIKISNMTKVTSQALYKKNIEIKEKKKKIT